jgi:hypothetical protein
MDLNRPPKSLDSFLELHASNDGRGARRANAIPDLALATFIAPRVNASFVAKLTQS